MCIVYAIANQKGGCSKTSVTVNLGVGLAMEGKKVLVIDADPQGSLTISLGYPAPDFCCRYYFRFLVASTRQAYASGRCLRT